MDLEFDDDQQELRQSVQAVLDKECPVEVVRKVVESGEPATELWTAMVALDWPALCLPEDCGGLGLGPAELAVVVEEMGAHLVPGPYLATATQFAPVVAAVGDDEQRRRLLTPVAAEGATGALALADHPKRFDLDSVTSRAQAEGDGWRLSGTKTAVLAEPGTTEVAVVARVADGYGVFVVPGDQLELQPVRALDPSRQLASVVLDGVVVPGARALGSPGSTELTGALTRGLEQATLAVALECLGTCQALFDLTLAYAKDRHQFGVPIGSFQAIKHKLANLYVALQRARSLAYYAVAALVEDDPGRALAVAMAKAGTAEAQHEVCRDAIQTFGGIGFTWEHDAHLYVKRATTTGALLGSAGEQRLAVAAALGVTAG